MADYESFSHLQSVSFRKLADDYQYEVAPINASLRDSVTIVVTLSHCCGGLSRLSTIKTVTDIIATLCFLW